MIIIICLSVINNSTFKKPASGIILLKYFISHLVLTTAFNNRLPNNIKCLKIIIIKLFNVLSYISKIKVKFLLRCRIHVRRLSCLMNLWSLLVDESIFIFFFFYSEALPQMFSWINKNLFDIFNLIIIFVLIMIIKNLIILCIIFLFLDFNLCQLIPHHN